MAPERLSYLLKRYAEKNCSATEIQELDVLLQDDWSRIELAQSAPGIDWEKMYYEITAAPVIKLQKRTNKRLWYRVAIAASVALLLGAGSYFLFFTGKTTSDRPQTIVQQNDIKAPVTNHAMITLADGSKVSLDSISKGLIATQGNANVVKTAEGQIIYSTGSEANNLSVQYNTLTNPRGSKVVSITLIDGTRVWLNAESSLKYFTVVGKIDRRIEVTGECYFEVAHDVSKPFIVKDVTRGAEVQVLGTHFNINTYADEPVMKVTLLEGSVAVRQLQGEKTVVIKPGEQAQVSDKIKVVSGINTDEVMAWKNGLFSFDRADIKAVMRQIARWYDVDVVYKGHPTTDVFGGDIQRDLSLSKVLDFLQKSQVHFVVDGKKLTVMQ